VIHGRACELPLLTLTHALRGIGAVVARAPASVRLLLLNVEVLATLGEVLLYDNAFNNPYAGLGNAIG